MQTRQLGTGGPAVSALGLGTMAMSGIYGAADDAESIATIHAALEAGVTLIDTGDFYGMGKSEMVLGQALAGGKRDRAFVSVKFGAMRHPSGPYTSIDARPDAVKNFLGYTLQRLGTDHIDLYMPARLDPAVPIEETVGAIAEMIEAGYVRHLGLSEVSAATVRRAHAVHPVAALQIEYSLFSRGIEAEILPTLRELGIATVAYGIVSRGLIDAPASADALRGVQGPRSHMPRFQGDNIETNLALVARLDAIAQDLGLTVGQLAFAWVLSRGGDIVPLIGTKRRERLAEALGALDATLDDETLAQIEAAVPPGAAAGARYPSAGMAQLDSERPVSG